MMRCYRSFPLHFKEALTRREACLYLLGHGRDHVPVLRSECQRVTHHAHVPPDLLQLYRYSRWCSRR